MDCSSITDFQQSTAIRIAKKFRNLHIGNITRYSKDFGKYSLNSDNIWNDDNSSKNVIFPSGLQKGQGLTTSLYVSCEIFLQCGLQ